MSMPSINLPLPVPHFEQEHGNSCLPACVRMVLSFWGTESTELALRKVLKTKPAGTNPFNVTHLKELEFEARMSFSNLEELKSFLSQSKPAIAILWTGNLGHWNSTKYFDYLHTVVAIGFDQEGILVNDPAFSNHPIAIPFAEFLEAWSYSQQMLVIIERS